MNVYPAYALPIVMTIPVIHNKTIFDIIKISDINKLNIINTNPVIQEIQTLEILLNKFGKKIK
jgi:hypothetical protein